MKKRNFKNKLISILIVAVMLIGTLPVYATVPSVAISNPFNYDAAYAFNPAGESYLVMQMTKAAIEAEKKPYVEYSVYVEEAGEYKIDFKSSPIVSPKYTSPSTVTINGSELSGISQVKHIDDNTREYVVLTNLSAGKNRVRFTVTGERANGGNSSVFGLFHLFYINVTPCTSKTIVDGNTLVVEAENYETATCTLTERTDNATSCYGNDYYHTNVKQSAVTLIYNVSAADEGFYDMTLYASSKENYLGRFEVLINGALVGDMRDNGAFASYKKTICGNATWMIREFYPVKVKLNKGANTLIIRSYDKGTNGNYGFALDCFKFAPKSKILAFDDVGGVASGTGYYGGKAKQLFVDGTQNYTLDVLAGTYDLYVCAGSSVWTNYLGTLSFKLGNNEYVDFTTNNVTKGESVTSTAGHFKYNEAITLSGNETLEFKCTAKATANANNYVMFDYFELVPRGVDIGKADITVNSNKLACGDTMQAESKLYYTNCYVVGSKQNPGAKFTSSNPEIATVDADGLITAVKPGIATITAEYTASSSASTNVIVYDESGIVPVSTKYDAKSGLATIELTSVTDESNAPTVMFSAYGNDNSFKSVVIEENVNIERGKVTTLKKNISGDNVKAFLWESVSGLKPVIPVVDVYSAKKDKFSEYVDFTVDVEEGREPVILHLADTQIIDSAQKRYSSRIGADATEFWATDRMDELCFDYLKEAVAETKPDLILLTGDIVYGEFDDNGSALTKLIDAMESLDTPWAPIYGNHDNESNLGVNWQSAKLEAAPNCLFKQRTLTGNGNYSVGITQGGELKRVFFMLDSNGGTSKSSKTMANGHSVTTTGFGQDQIDWYTAAAEKINGAYPGMKYSMVYHIHQFIFNHGYNKYSSFETPVDIATIQDEVANAPGTDFGYIGKKLDNGWNTDLTIYRGAKALGFDSHFVGHEHAQSVSLTHDGTLLQFGQKSSAYDSLNWIDADGNVVNGSCLTNATPMVGGTVLKMNDDGSFGTRYIHYCDGVVNAE